MPERHPLHRAFNPIHPISHKKRGTVRGPSFLVLLFQGAEEGPEALRLRRIEEFLRCALLDDHAAVHEDDAVRHLPGEAHLVGDDDHRILLFGEALHDAEDLAGDLRVEGRGRLIEEQQLRFHGEHAGDGHALLLAAGKLRRISLGAIRQTDACEKLLRIRLRLFPALAADDARGIGDILEAGHVREKIEMLEDHTGAAINPPELLLRQVVRFFVAAFVVRLPGLLRRNTGKELAVQGDAPAADSRQAVDGAKQGALPGAGGSDDGDRLAREDAEADSAEHLFPLKGLLDVLHLQYRCHLSLLPDITRGAALDAAENEGHDGREDEVDPGSDHIRDQGTVPVDHALRDAHHLGEADAGCESGILDQDDDLVRDRRNDDAEHLRQYDIEKRPRPGESERVRGFILTAVDGAETAPVDFGEICRIVDDEGQARGREGRHADAELNREEEIEEKELQHERRSAEDEDEGLADPANRCNAAVLTERNRETEREGEDQGHREKFKREEPALQESGQNHCEIFHHSS